MPFAIHGYVLAVGCSPLSWTSQEEEEDWQTARRLVVPVFCPWVGRILGWRDDGISPRKEWISTKTETPHCVRLQAGWILCYLAFSLKVVKMTALQNRLLGYSILEEEEKGKQVGIPPLKSAPLQRSWALPSTTTATSQLSMPTRLSFGLSFPPSPSSVFSPPAAFLSKCSCRELGAHVHCFACVAFHFSYFTRDRAHVSLQADNRQAGIGGKKGLRGKTHTPRNRGRHTYLEMLNPQKFRGEGFSLWL